MSADSASLIARLAERGLTLAVAESLTGGLLVAELIRPGGASQVVLGGIVAYETELKFTLLDVDRDLLDTEGPVHPEVAAQMAFGVRRALAVGGRPADVGLSTTGVAGPEPQGGREPGTVFIALSARDGRDIGDERKAGDEPRGGAGTDGLVRELSLTGDRDSIRRQSVDAALDLLDEWLGEAP